MNFSSRLRWVGVVVMLAGGCGGNDPIVPHDPASITKVLGDGQTALAGTVLAESLAVEVRDAGGQGVGQVAVSWTVVQGGGTVTAAASATDAAGRLAASWTLGAVGVNSVTASAFGFSVTFTATATSTPPPLPHLAVITQPADGQSGVSLPGQPVVQLRDSLGNPLSQPGVAVTATIASGSTFASLGGTTTVSTAANGRATFSNLTITGPVGSYTLGFAAQSFVSVVSGALSLSTVSGRVPLTDMGNRTYFGFTGGLYPGSNSMPAAHAAAGAARARNVRPLNTSGNPSPTGTFVLLSIGLSNTTQEWCSAVTLPCNSWTFTGQAGADGAVNHTTLSIINGAKGSQDADKWRLPTDPNYDRIRDSALAPQGFSEEQVQVIWLKVVKAQPPASLPAANADAIKLVTQYGDILRTLKTRYPNLQMVFMSSRIFAGYATTQLNPEPFAYESGLAVKWIIEAQIDQMATGGTVVDPRAGDLNYTGVAPWVAWGPYLWADGLNPRSDGLTWSVSEFSADGTHPNTAGETKVGTQLLTFFKTDLRASCWFLTGASCP